ncbi:LysR family transcriptional regulator [Mesorhizobium sp. M2D.F.Ca.ET.185.01.1.1]|uniref:LysR family transcriptional regulator n=1 Tax=unclassified Mesorhizobium TaxID=325217 RepID=UPI000FCB3254|nr:MULTISPECIES: LysR family transcriptional regulator [unclassified Mesorhizobium]TGP83423.1 LysR family transcriptional regulator [bacterium M00.F.Ca.ET.227.01.1.1]TGP99378.1 LysR family transcriptional regulator [bacterium M00.F.Ca.ET.221.01.1.1]TGQ00108.1 LysR family transcriptional regulator [bacterium M00.F.Ca.ET.222.01.1.1]TGU11494.1 LysR family transcriptional regulator [bacterium M00.F.Ca.ET.163.01.1.1]TGU35093.1 LysR family transcriptional regulator [bacterium M00.F.Ca.ET.156.01.1.1]
MKEFDWNLIKSFVAVAETGSLSGAARRLAASQPTLGRHIAELEAALGVTLFRRGRRGYELTEAGSTLYERGQAVSEQASAFSLLALGSVEAIEGTVRVAASEVVAAFVLPDMMARLGEEEPGIEVEIVASNQVENLLRRDADIAIRMVRPAQNELVARKVTDIPLCLCAASSYLDRRGRPAKPADLADHALVGFDRSDEIIRGLTSFGIPVGRSHFRFRTDNQIVLWEAVRSGNGIGIGQEPLVDRDPDIEKLPFDVPLPELPVWLAMHRDVRTSMRIRRVADFLHEELKRYSAGTG